MNPFSCTIIQFDVPLEEPKEETLSRMVSAIEAAAADLVVFPELATTGYHVFDRLDDLAEPVGGETTETLGAAADAADSEVLFGMPLADGEAVYNAAVWLDSDGDVRARYDKRHLWGDERDAFDTGERYLVVEAPFGRVGVQICYDLAFPEASAALAREECDLFVNLSAWTVKMERDWQTLLPARAVEQGAYVIGCNRAGTEAGDSFCGSSMVVEPDGTTISELGNGPGRLTATLEPGIVAAERRRNPMRVDRQDDRTDAESTERKPSY
ncbi:carbon-nitrogen hydrolase family protein [Natronomonas sp. CBA1123]|uniref:carbon-nitrogen hydrolase family protein n=1 Tax=Natronomonas sp. CBA1123 TaxID=2668070 RepID=UPI0012EAAFCC|nr:carbon-nitrogen hydrolase family protein [Natronomonas sp. CBA1123]MUV87552.1 carbon-nitrogen hydrolase family protein [Natronomonas sp. CBA1123]